MNDQETQRLLNNFSAAWERYTHATDSDARYEAKGDYQQYAFELALWMMGQSSPTETITELDPIWGNSPDETEIPNDAAGKLTVRDFIVHIHTAAQQSRRTASASARTLLYIDIKTKEGIQIRTRDRHLKSTLYHVKAMISSTNTAEQKIIRIEQITAMALDLPFQAVQS